MREALTIQTPVEGVTVSLETMDMPVCFEPPLLEESAESRNEVNEGRKRSSSATLRSLLCRTVEVDDVDVEETQSDFEMTTDLPAAKRATLILRTRRHNEPLIRVRQGNCELRNLELRHVSHGIGKFFLYLFVSHHHQS